MTALALSAAPPRAALPTSQPAMPASLLAVGLNHASAPLDLRGRYAVPVDRLASTLQDLREHLLARGAPATGLTLLSTCNRTELYLGGPDAAELLAPVETWFAAQGGAGPEDLRPHRYVHQDADVARHAFRVAAGLDSAVLGEPQILGQLKTAVRTADAAGMRDPDHLGHRRHVAVLLRHPDDALAALFPSFVLALDHLHAVGHLGDQWLLAQDVQVGGKPVPLPLDVL